MIKIKQTNSIALAFCLLISVFVGMLAWGTPTASAYTCADPNNPADIYEYHESDGLCWKVRYTDRRQNPPTASCNSSGQCSCPNNAPFVLNGQCRQTCASGDQYHADTNSCWYQNGYTGNGGQVQPTNNDGTPITAANSTCSDGFIYLPNGNGTSGPGCYDRAADGSFPCAPDQDVDVTGNRAGTSESCGDAVKKHLVPKDKQQNADRSRANPACARYTGAEKAACQAAANNPNQNCNQQPNQQQQDACNAGRTASTNGTSGSGPDLNPTGTNCGEAETVLVACKGEGVQALGDVLRIIIFVLTTIVGIAAVGGLAWASVLYAKAEDNQSNVSQAKDWIRNIAIGIIVYGFMIAIINWLVPGGVIG